MNPKMKAFDCVAESRKWREAAGEKLNAMSEDEELAYLYRLRERVKAQLLTRQGAAAETLVLREEAPGYDGTA